MLIHVDRAAFVEAASRAASFSGGSMPVVRIDARGVVRLSATDTERFCRLSVDANITKPGAIVVDSARLAAVVKGLTASTVKISATDTRATIECGATYTIPVLDDVEIAAPEFPEDSATVPGAALTRAFAATAYAVGGGQTGVAGVAMELGAGDNGFTSEVFVTSTDGHRLGHSAFTTKGRITLPPLTLLTPEACRGLGSLGGSVKIGFTPGWVHAEIGSDAYAWRCINGEFPLWRGIVPAACDKVLTVSFRPADVLGAMKRANAVISKAARPTVMTIGENGCSIFTPGDTEHAETIPCEVVGGAIVVGVRPAYLIDAVQSLGTVDRVCFDVFGARKPIIIKPNGESESMAIVSPMAVA